MPVSDMQQLEVFPKKSSISNRLTEDTELNKVFVFWRLSSIRSIRVSHHSLPEPSIFKRSDVKTPLVLDSSHGLSLDDPIENCNIEITFMNLQSISGLISFGDLLLILDTKQEILNSAPSYESELSRELKNKILFLRYQQSQNIKVFSFLILFLASIVLMLVGNLDPLNLANYFLYLQLFSLIIGSIGFYYACQYLKGKRNLSSYLRKGEYF